MPRQARLDAPGTLHHVIIRGIEKKLIVKDEADRRDFIDRVGKLALELKTPIYAWALMPNHAHILLRSGPKGLPKFMRRLLTGYATAFNRRHQRHGHLFQNRYKSIICDEDSYFRELVRYIHLNPLRANLVPNLASLNKYPWCGQGALMGIVNYPWMHSDYVLSWFGKSAGQAREAYRDYVEEGIPMGRRPELVGGGLIRSQGGWSQVMGMQKRKGRECYDERILGPGDFVERIIREADEYYQRSFKDHFSARKIETLIQKACAAADIGDKELRSGSRRREISKVRWQLAINLIRKHGISLAETARQLGVSTPAISNLLKRRGVD